MSPTLTEANPAVDNSLDDIFGSRPPPETREVPSDTLEIATSTTEPSDEPSDLPSLRRQHVTSGYREGISTSKGEHIQRGFDAGYPVGAQLGMRAGTVLGILEGITRGLEAQSTSGVVKKPAARGAAGSSSVTRSAETVESRRRLREQVLKIYLEASKGLDVRPVFTGAGVGPGSGSKTQSAPGEQAGKTAEAQLGRQGNVVVSTWEEKVAVSQWEKNMEALEMKESQGEGKVDKVAVAERS